MAWVLHFCLWMYVLTKKSTFMMIVSVKTELNEEHRFVNAIVYWCAKHLAIVRLYPAQKHAWHTSKQFTQPDLTFVEKSTCPLWSRVVEPAVVEKTPVTINGCEATQNAAVTVVGSVRQICHAWHAVFSDPPPRYVTYFGRRSHTSNRTHPPGWSHFQAYHCIGDIQYSTLARTIL